MALPQLDVSWLRSRSLEAARLRSRTGVGPSTLKVAFLNHVGDAVGGAEKTLALSIAHLPSSFESFAILFEDGAFANELRRLGVRVAIVPAPPMLMNTKRERLTLAAAFAVPALANSVAKVLRAWGVDVLYTNSMKAHVVGSLSGRLSGIPCVMHFHDHFSGLGLSILRAVAQFGSNERIACSQAVMNEAAVGKTTVVYSPVDKVRYSSLPAPEMARRYLGVDPNLPTVSLVGRINRWKGHDRFLRIAADVSARRPTQFLIVGSAIFRDEDFPDELQGMVRELGLQDVVHFIPWVDDMRNVYGASDIVANCSTREPLGRTPAEAAAAGVPSVVFSDSGAAEWIRDSAHSRIVPAHDEKLFADAIVEMFEAGAASRAYAGSIRREAERFDAASVADELAGVIRQTAGVPRSVTVLAY